MSGSLIDKVALVTGGGSGIGRATSLVLAREGAHVVVSDIDDGSGAETAELIESSGGKSVFMRCDVTDSADVASMIQSVIERFGKLDCAHNNAGIGSGRFGDGRTDEVDETAWDRIMSVNLKGVWLCMKHEIPSMRDQGFGVIVNTASALGLVGQPGASAYVTSKHGIVGMTRTAALENAQNGVRINAVCPGWTETPFTEASQHDPSRRAFMTSKQPIGRIGKPEETAEAVAWLFSDAASFVTGTAMAVDGGWTAQ